MVKEKKFDVRLKYDTRCNYVEFIKEDGSFYYLEVTESELQGLEYGLEIEAEDYDITNIDPETSSG